MRSQRQDFNTDSVRRDYAAVPVRVPPMLPGRSDSLIFLKLDADITALMLNSGESGTATEWIDNPDWGTGIDPYIETDPPVALSDVVPWDKVTPLAADTLYAAMRSGGYVKILHAACEAE